MFELDYGRFINPTIIIYYLNKFKKTEQKALRNLCINIIVRYIQGLAHQHQLLHYVTL